MSIPVTLVGVPYLIPETGEQGWGDDLTSYLVAIANGTLLTLEGGPFTLLADVIFGPNYGVRAPYFRSGLVNAADDGVLRLTNTEAIAWRNAANTGNNLLTVNGDLLEFNGAMVDGTTAWGRITGSLSAQTDLQTVLDNKQPLSIELNGISALATTGIVQRTGAGTYVASPVDISTAVTGILDYANGGTAASTRQDAINNLAGGVTANRVLRADGTNILLGQVSLTTDVSGTLPISSGGTGQTTQQAALNALAGGVTNNRVLRANGVNITLAQVSLATDVTDNLPVSKLNTGTGATSTSFWRGDGTWAVPTYSASAVAGSTTQIQYNSSGLFGASASFTFDVLGGNKLVIGSAGGSSIIESGYSTGSTSNIGLTIRGNSPTASGASGGFVAIAGGNGSSTGTAQSGGSVTITAGNAVALGSAGFVSLQGGAGSSASAGGVSLIGGAGSSTATGGNISITAGSASAAGGVLSLSGGASSGSTGGAVNITAGLGFGSVFGAITSTAATITESATTYKVVTGSVERLRILSTGDWSVGSAGTNVGSLGQVLTSNGSGSAPTWATSSTSAPAYSAY